MRKPRFAIARGFTLVEVLVALAVFLLLVLLVTQLVTDTSRNTMRENNRMDVLGDTRQALDRFGQDWAARLQRKDVDWSVAKVGDNDAIQLLSRVPAYEGARRLAAVSYRINPSQYVLERGSAGYDWDTGSGSKLIFGKQALQPPTPPDRSYEVLSSTIFRLSLSYLDKKTGNWTNAAPGKLTSADLGGVVISVAALDERNRAILSKDQLEALGQALPDAQGTNNPLTSWAQKLSDPAFLASLNIPRPVGSSVRVYQRVYYVEQ